jgi:aspartyl aminopeptidase
MEDFKSFIDRSTCPPVVVRNIKEMLKSSGFEELELKGDWKVSNGGKYYVDVFGTSLIAFRIGRSLNSQGRICIAASHTDSPCFVVKPSPEILQGKYNKINVETYGGAILNTWLDRPLGLAGSVVLKSEDSFKPAVKVIDSVRPVFVIPNIAIHFNRDVNKGVELNKQKDMLPLAGLNGDIKDEKFFIKYVASLADCKPEDILDWQLYLYNTEKLTKCGISEEMIMSPRIDNLSSAYSSVAALCESTGEKNLNMIAVFDNEEVGSRTKQGAASGIIYRVLKKIYASLARTQEELDNALSDGLMLSIDVAHAMHPNQPDKNDPTNQIFLNDGIAIKRAAGQSYATDAVSSAIIKDICLKNNIKFKEFVNKSDIPGGSTLGVIAAANLSIRTVDVGIPILAMHSAVETAGARDVAMMTKLVSAVFDYV